MPAFAVEIKYENISVFYLLFTCSPIYFFCSLLKWWNGSQLLSPLDSPSVTRLYYTNCNRWTVVIVT